jgi:hypothetical protein
MTEQVTCSVRTSNLVVGTGGFFVWTVLIRPNANEPCTFSAAFWTLRGTVVRMLELAVAIWRADISFGTRGRVITSKTTFCEPDADVVGVLAGPVI